MNKRRREILAALAPAIQHAGEREASEGRDKPGLAMIARTSAGAPAQLMIYGRIGGGPFDGGITAIDVSVLLREAGPGPINVQINSEGGDVFDGVAIHSLLARHPGTVTCFVDGLAASAASFIMLAGDRIVAARNAMIMIHDGMTGAYGNAATLRRSAELLDKVSENIADMYAERAGEDPEHWRTQMTVNGEDGTWFTGQEAHTAGLVDELIETPDEDEDDPALWNRLAAHVDILPAVVAEKVREKTKDAVPDVDPPEWPDGEEPDEDDVEIPDVPDDDTDKDIGSADFAYSMSMWAWMNKNGHTARKEAA